MILERLRAATAAAHRELEEEVGIEQVLQSREHYGRLLQKFLGFHGPLEEHLLRLPGWADVAPAPATRRKAPWLVEDLAALGLTIPAPVCPRLPEAGTLAAAWGCAWVLEGSTLGGRHILHLPQAADLPRRFFTGYGAETGRRWKDFCAALEAAPEAGDATIAAAAETFARLQDWLRL